MKMFLLILILALNIFPCGAPQHVFGRLTADFPIFAAIVTIAPVGGPQYPLNARANAFGYFNFYDVTPCLSYKLTVRSKPAMAFPLTEFYVPGDAEGVQVNIHGEFWRLYGSR